MTGIVPIIPETAAAVETGMAGTGPAISAPCRLGGSRIPGRGVPQRQMNRSPVRIAVLAMESLCTASMRASFSGTEVCVAVPDATTAAIFPAAIAETSRTRSTDRLIRIVVE
jgi:hypothetical protein